MRIEKENAHGQCFRIDGVSGDALGFAREETRGDGDQNAGAVAGFSIGVDSAPVPNRLERSQRKRDDFTARLAVDRSHQANANPATSAGTMAMWLASRT